MGTRYAGIAAIVGGALGIMLAPIMVMVKYGVIDDWRFGAAEEISGALAGVALHPDISVCRDRVGDTASHYAKWSTLAV